jgi:hypothetical protein
MAVPVTPGRRTQRVAVILLLQVPAREEIFKLKHKVACES